MRFSTTFARAFYSAALYRQLRREGRYAFGYSFKLVMLTSFVVVFALAASLHVAVFSPREGHPSLLEATVAQIVPQLPAMSWHEGRLQTAQPGRYEVKIVFNGEHGPESATLLTIDTGGGLNEANAPRGLSLTADRAITRSSSKIETHLLSDYSSKWPRTMALNRAVYHELAQKMLAWLEGNLPWMYLILGALLWVALVLYFYVGRVLMQLLLAALLKLVQRLLHEPLGWPQAMAVVAVAYTPVAVVDMFVMILCYRGTPLLALLAAGFAAAWFALVAADRREAGTL